MKKLLIIKYLEEISSENDISLTIEDDMQLKEAFSQIPLQNEKIDDKELLELEELIFDNKIHLHLSRRTIILKRYISIAVLLAFIVASGLMIKNSDVSYMTKNGEQLSFVLPDRSIVKLNENSMAEYNKLLFKFNKKVYMSGEAYYVVAKDGKFTVETMQHKISVLGTRFVVSQKEMFDVICYEGKVMVESLDNGEKKVLTKGMSLSPDKIIKEQEPVWINNNYVFSNTPLIDVLEALEKEYKITIENKELCKGAYFTGSFPTGNLSLALDVVLIIYDMGWEIVSPEIYMIKVN